MEERLRAKGFHNDITPGAPLCRWVYKQIIVDVMPIDDNILGFSNQWYGSGVEHKITCTLPDGTDIFIFSAPHYLGAKFEAMLSRGGNDLRISHDFEDIIYILDNSIDIVKQISKTDEPLQNYLTSQFRALLANSNIEEAIECVLPYGADERVKYIIEILNHDYTRL